jgi:hypothetical protein
MFNSTKYKEENLIHFMTMKEKKENNFKTATPKCYLYLFLSVIIFLPAL